MRLAPFLILSTCLGCASGPYRWPGPTDNPNAAPAAVAAANAYTRKPMPDRRRVERWEFYYKHCAVGDPTRPWHSKTSYDCNGPF